MIDIPEPASLEMARRSEQEYLNRQGPEMEKRYRATVESLEKGKELAEFNY